MSGRTSKNTGDFFENVLIRQAYSNGLLPLRNGTTARFIPGGRVILEKSDLDFRVLARGGVVAYLDAKSFDAERVPRSDLDPEQQGKRAADYVEWGFAAGFVVWFRPLNRVVFLRGDTVYGAEKGTSFGPEDGRELGRLERFDLRLVWLRGESSDSAAPAPGRRRAP